ncbi:DNA primase regulatory subunit PriL [Archaeoglobus profundus]|uniref:DNA primase large subunit PriL n=1 Tax=Archaeoglobus profundus (strain DSM 5631 / JCM 9629 / NBRC 100127 / Av18) TaxID=572546 RepID=D2RDW2_ARCPA|nr:DNA primase regulatory subunit PriL [Archaeoglobus profundus]ADB58306.1 DNA primase, large subunit [Archaeoglobus profundus DSM 5631]
MKRPFLPILPFLARYPFLSYSKIFEFTQEEILSDLEDAKEFVKTVLESDVENVTKPLKLLCSDCGVREECEGFECCTYPAKDYSVMLNRAEKAVLKWLRIITIVSNLDDFLRRRFAVRMSRVYREMLKAEMDDFLIVVAWDLGLRLDKSTDLFGYLKSYYVMPKPFAVDLVDYLKLAVRIKDESWKLVNRKVVKGYVYLSRDEFVRLIEELMKDKFMERLPIKVDVDLGVKVKREYKFESLPIEFECFPECMKKIIADLNEGKNVPHTGRFAIASFLINLGCSVDKVVEIFRNAPDFDEDKTRYQVEHIAGMRGKGEKYIAPSCETMKSWGLCIWNCEIDHPIKYYRRCLSERRGGGKRASKRKSNTSNDT